MGMINDASFIIAFEKNLWEHQSTYNPNLPLRILIYVAKLYEKYILTHNIYVYASTLKKIPRPKCICFYNGTDEQPEKKVFRLSEAYDGEGDVEVTVTMLNINYSRNKKLMDSCKPLYEYSWIVNEIRQNRGDNLEETIDKVINSIPEDFVIRSFIMGHRAEVKGMFLTEWNQEKVLQQEREDSLEQGREQGIAEGITRMVAGMLKKNLPRPMIAEISNLPDEVIANIASQL